MDHNTVLSYDYAKQKSRQRQMNAPPSQAILMAMLRGWCGTCNIPWCSMTRAFIKATKCCHRANTRSVSPRQPPGRQQTKRSCKMYPLCWPFQWTLRCGSTIPTWLSYKPLNAAIGRALTLIGINRTCLPLFQRYISSSNRWKRARVALLTIRVWHIKLMRST